MKADHYVIPVRQSLGPMPINVMARFIGEVSVILVLGKKQGRIPVASLPCKDLDTRKERNVSCVDSKRLIKHN